jgi:hypothetical protein
MNSLGGNRKTVMFVVKLSPREDFGTGLPDGTFSNKKSKFG